MQACQKWMDCPAHLLLSKKHCAYSSFMHYVFTKILRYFHAVLDCASMKADVLHFHTYLGQLPSFWNRLTGAGRLFSLPIWSSRYHNSYGVEPHMRKQPCTAPADPQHTCILRSKNRFYLFGGFEFREC
ncbi:hypothetical protein Tsp_11136 [Trichinella spiralis]|uniref:hypothetical protein n=1 Tax=Trichinella spiralis TaxID=6334 RepID=UPI0001EFEADF|nr:hypothetical protein Tsp_11136 [Trichinella spiralis]